MARTRKPVLVTGSHRSGTTWVGQILAEAPGTEYIHEPFNILSRDSQFEYWFQYICRENAHQYQKGLMDLIEHRYPLGEKLKKAKTARDLARIARDQCRTLYHRARNSTPIMKDPIAVFSAEWMAEALDMNIVVLIRHPAAFCSSLKLKEWRHDFSHFLEQPLLMKRYLRRFEDEIREYTANEQDVLSQAILLWNCIHHTISTYQDEHPEWMFMKHEALSSDPLGQFHKMYDFLGLEFTPRAKTAILESSGAHNPAEQQPGNEFVRNSKENILNWKHRLTQDEILRIRKETREISERFYTESDW